MSASDPPATTATDALSASMVAFITSHLSIQLAACPSGGSATLVRAVGVRVSDDHRQVTVLVPRSQSLAVLQAVGSNGRVAAVFSEPVSNVTVQLKGRDGRVEPATAADEAGLAPYAEQFARRLIQLGLPEAYTRALVACSPGDLAAVSFSPCEVYGQTPGPHAGERLPSGGMPS